MLIALAVSFDSSWRADRESDDSFSFLKNALKDGAKRNCLEKFLKNNLSSD